MRILYAGTPEIAVPTLEHIASEFEVCGVLTNPDRIKGRGKKISASPVKLCAEKLGLPVLQFETLGAEARKAVEALKPDILVVFAFGKIFGPKFLSLFKMGGINVHPSLLPKYRGSSPILSAILNGDKESGITVQKVALKMDTGDILKQISFPLTGTETTGSLSGYVARESAPLVAEVLKCMERGCIEPVPQDESAATYCTMISKDDGLIDWNESCGVIERKIRAFDPWPGSFTFLGDKKLNILKAHIPPSVSCDPCVPGKVAGVDKAEGILIQTVDGVLAVSKLQLQSKKALDWKDFINGTPNIIGSLLGGSR